MSKQARAKMYEDFLRNEGFAPSIDDDGDVVFKCEGRTYIIWIDEDDEDFFRLVFPSFWPIESEEERLHVLIASQHATSKAKVAKIYMVGDDTWGSIEMFCSPPEAFKPVFRRCIPAIQAAVGAFREKMQELSSEGSAPPDSI